MERREKTLRREVSQADLHACKMMLQRSLSAPNVLFMSQKLYNPHLTPDVVWIQRNSLPNMNSEEIDNKSNSSYFKSKKYTTPDDPS